LDEGGKELGFWEGGKIARTDLIESAFGGEDGDVAVVARTRSAAHLEVAGDLAGAGA
jgi:hypothetical protein